MKALTILMFSGNIAFNAIANILMKIGVRNLHEPGIMSVSGLISDSLSNWKIIAGVFSYTLSLGFYMLAIRNVKLSVAYPLSVNCTIVVVTALSALLLKESISIRQLTGGGVILVGLFLLTS
jgi:multidrug transporter EmrE-like cation transporter